MSISCTKIKFFQLPRHFWLISCDTLQTDAFLLKMKRPPYFCFASFAPFVDWHSCITRWKLLLNNTTYSTIYIQFVLGWEQNFLSHTNCGIHNFFQKPRANTRFQTYFIKIILHLIAKSNSTSILKLLHKMRLMK